jgi:hypothetical protein
MTLSPSRQNDIAPPALVRVLKPGAYERESGDTDEHPQDQSHRRNATM